MVDVWQSSEFDWTLRKLADAVFRFKQVKHLPACWQAVVSLEDSMNAEEYAYLRRVLVARTIKVLLPSRLPG